MLPGVDRLLELAKGISDLDHIPRTVLIRSSRFVIDGLRKRILATQNEFDQNHLTETALLHRLVQKVKLEMKPNLLRTINATGVVVHTNLGRSRLPAETIENVALIAGTYSNLEFNLSEGVRGSRYACVEELLCEISGAEAAMVVNNNAGAVLLCLETLARQKKAIVSRGELIEIGGAFRIPDVMAKSGTFLTEVGTTNRTHLRDYENAIAHDTALLLKVHTSNYCIVGFTAEVALGELVELGTRYHLPVMQDLGSGTFIDFSKYGLIKEPTVQESVDLGTDIITFSGDKLLGGPQAGIIVGKKEILERIKKNPLTRALRVDKMTLAALESILRLYRTEAQALETIPTLHMLTLPLTAIQAKAKKLQRSLSAIDNPHLHLQLIDRSSRAGGGSLQLLEIPSKCVGLNVDGLSASTIDQEMRANDPPVIARIEEDLFVMDLRTVQEEEIPIIVTAFKQLLQKASA